MSTATVRYEIIDLLLESVALLLADLSTGEILYATKPTEDLLGITTRGGMLQQSIDTFIPGRVAEKYPSPPLSARHVDGRLLPVEVSPVAAIINKRACILVIILAAQLKPLELPHVG